MGVLKHKIVRDIWANKTRTLQVMLIIGISAAAIGMILGTRNLVVPGMQDIWTSQNPAMINFFIFPEIDEDELFRLSRVSGVAEIEAYNSTTIEWRLSPSEDWRQGGLTARADYENQGMNRLELIKGEWPYDRKAVAGNDATFHGTPMGTTVYLRANNREFQTEIIGELYDQLSQPATFGGLAQFYVNQDYYEYIVGNRNFGRVLVKADHWDEDYVTQIADQFDRELERMGKDSGRFITNPNKHFFQDQMDGLFFLLGVLAMISLVLGLLLVYNTINSIISAQTDQIGVMKAIGARTRQVVGLYFSMILIYGLLSLTVALPLSIMGAWGVSSWLVSSFGADLGEFELDQQAIIVSAALALIAPLVAALAPIWNAARITVREAISTYGLSTKAGLIEKIITRLRFLSRMVMLTISNTFRHKWRVVLLQLALVLSGVVFMMVVAVRDSVVYTFDDLLFEILNANITMVFEDPQRIDYIENLTMKFPGIKTVEMWGFGSGTIRKQGQPFSDDDDQLQLFGVPLPTQTYGYQLRAGRWLNPNDQYAIVLNVQQADDLEVQVSDWVTVRYSDKKERDYQVVGLVFDPLLTTVALVERDQLLRDLGIVDRSGAVWIQTEQEGLVAEENMAKALREYYKQNQITVSSQRGIFGLGGDSTTATANALTSQFNFLIVLLGIMAVVIGAVGSIALSGALALSVLERRREIGVMRAIGASSWSVFRLFIGEGLILGWLSWLIALPLSIPASRAMLFGLGEAFQFEIIYHYTPNGAILWFAIITLLSILASLLPARGATRVSVRESLAYQ